MQATTHEVPFRFREATADGSLRGVLLIRSGPGNLADRHYYTEESLKAAVGAGVFEGAKCFLDHPTPTEEAQMPERSVSRLGGYFSDAKIAPYTDLKLGECVGVYADFHPQVNREDVSSLLRTCAEYAVRYPTKAYVGLSISARGDGATADIDGQEWNRVDTISEVESVDIVTRAGAGGTFQPIKESYRMAKTATIRGQREARTTIDSKKVAAGVDALRESAKTKFTTALKESPTGIALTPEQDAALDAALGLIDGGALDEIIDNATGVSADSDADSLESDKMGEAVDEMVNKDCMDESEPKDFESAKLMLKNERAARKAMESKVKESAQRAKIAESNRERVGRELREVEAERIIADLAIPASHAPRLRDELLDRPLDPKTMRERATAFANVYVRPLHDSAGVPLREGSYIPKIDFNFDGGN